MGRFKSISKRKKHRRKLFKICFLILLLLVLNYIKNFKLESKYIDNMTSFYLGLNFSKLQSNEDEPLAVPSFKEEQEPTVYIYNTHQSEKYKYDKLTSYNIDYTVMFASYILSSYLKEYDIISKVEDGSISKVLNENNLKYKDSYKASRILMEKSFSENPTLKYFIDLHRDSSVYEKTTCIISDKTYAKVMFVVGLEHENYEKNKKIANLLNEKIKAVNPCLTRGILEKQGEGVDGIYNQDFNENVVLIELGGQYNYVEEVNNTLKVLASILYEYIMEDA